MADINLVVSKIWPFINGGKWSKDKKSGFSEATLKSNGYRISIVKSTHDKLNVFISLPDGSRLKHKEVYELTENEASDLILDAIESTSSSPILDIMDILEEKSGYADIFYEKYYPERARFEIDGKLSVSVSMDSRDRYIVHSFRLNSGKPGVKAYEKEGLFLRKQIQNSLDEILALL